MRVRTTTGDGSSVPARLRHRALRARARTSVLASATILSRVRKKWWKSLDASFATSMSAIDFCMLSSTSLLDRPRPRHPRRFVRCAFFTSAFRLAELDQRGWPLFDVVAW